MRARGFPGITLIPTGKRTSASLGGFGRLACLPPKQKPWKCWNVGAWKRCAAFGGIAGLATSERLGQEACGLSELARGVRQRSLVLAQASSTFTEEMELDDAVEELEPPVVFYWAIARDQLCARLEGASTRGAARCGFASSCSHRLKKISKR